MTSTPPGWLTDPRRLRQLNAVAALVEAAKYIESPVKTDWNWCFAGDCTQLTALAREILFEWDWPQEAMERWACDLSDGRRHAVLCINVSDVSGDTTTVVVDCRYTTPQIKDALPYQDWVKIE